MQKRLFATFITGAVVGGISTYIFIGAPVTQFLPGEVKVYTKTEYKTVPGESSDRIEEVPKYPDDEQNYAEEADSNDVSTYEAPTEESPESVTTQAEKFERSIASESEQPHTTEEATSEEASADQSQPESTPEQDDNAE